MDNKEQVVEQIWAYTINGQEFVTPSESYAARMDPRAYLIYESVYEQD